MTWAQRALLPDALLPDAFVLQERIVVLVDKAGLICGFCKPEDVPPGLSIECFPGECWAAAPVFAHAHLESFDAPSEEWRGGGFCAWVEKLLAWRETENRLDAQASAALSLAEMARFGCGLAACHVDVESFELPAVSHLPEVLSLLEVFAPGLQDLTYYPLAQAVARGGVALHAPYSVHPAVAQEVFYLFKTFGLVSIHLGEHPEERQLLAEGSGPMAELLQKRGRELPKQRWPSPVAWLAEMGGLRRGTLAIHGGDLSKEELQCLQESGVQMVFCPGTHQFFERPQPQFLAANLPLPALGCDSRASNRQLNPLREVALAWQMVPEPGPQAWWQALTQTGAQALHRGDLGALDLGKRARFLRLLNLAPALMSDAKDLCAFLCSGDSMRLEITEF